MRILLFFIFTTYFYTFHTFAGTPIFDAISAFEQGDDEKARTLFRSFHKGTPIAHPYCQHLMPDEMPVQEDVFKGMNPYKKLVEGWYQTSLALRQLKDGKDEDAKEVAYLKLLRLYAKEDLPAAAYACRKLAIELRAKEKRDHADEIFLREFILRMASEGNKNHFKRLLENQTLRPQIEKDALDEALNRGLAIKGNKFTGTILDPRSVLESGKRENVRITFNAGKVTDFAILGRSLKTKLETHGEGESLYELAAELGRTNDFFELSFYTTAAIFGQQEAQLSLAKSTKDETERLYWIAQGCEQDNTRALLSAADTLQNNPEREFPYLQRLIQLGQFEVIERYNQRLRSLERYEEVAATIGLVLDHASNLQFDEIVFYVFQLFDTMQQDLTFPYRQRVFDFLATQDNPFSYLSRGIFLTHYNDDKAIRDLKFAGNFWRHFEMAEEGGDDQAAFQIGIYKEKEGHSEEAIAAYKRAEAAGNTFVLNHLGFLLMEKRTPETDIQTFEYLSKAYKSEPTHHALAAYNLAMMHMYNRGGASKDLSLINKYFDEAALDPTLITDIDFERGYWLLTEDNPDCFEYLDKAAAQNHPEGLLCAGQYILFAIDNQSLENKRKGCDYIQRAYELGAKGAKVIYAVILNFGIEDVLEPNSELAAELSATFTEIENEFYVRLLEVLEVSQEEEHAEEEIPAKVAPVTPLSTTSSSSSPESEEDASHRRKVERVQGEVERLTGKKQIKLRKMKHLMGRMIELSSGYFGPATGGGSGHKGRIGKSVVSFHAPHGKGHNPSMMTGRRLEDIREALETESSSLDHPPKEPQKKKKKARKKKK